VQIFIDTANPEEIAEANSWGVVDGVTTNPKIMLAERGCNFRERIERIVRLVDGPVHVEVTTNDWQEMVEQAQELAGWHRNIVIKIPMGIPGLKAVNQLKRLGIKTNVTAVMSVNQTLLAAKAGADYASIFFGRIGDMGYEPVQIVRDAVQLLSDGQFDSKILVGSIRQLADVNRAVLAGAQVVTIPFLLLKQMTVNPKTDETIAEFMRNWQEFRQCEPATDVDKETERVR